MQTTNQTRVALQCIYQAHFPAVYYNLSRLRTTNLTSNLQGSFHLALLTTSPALAIVTVDDTCEQIDAWRKLLYIQQD